MADNHWIARGCDVGGMKELQIVEMLSSEAGGKDKPSSLYLGLTFSSQIFAC